MKDFCQPNTLEPESDPQDLRMKTTKRQLLSSDFIWQLCHK